MEKTSEEKYLDLIKEEFFTKIERVKLFTNHAPSIGFGNEEILRNFLKTHIPERFAVGTGFVYLNNDSVSRQCDLLIYDHVNYAPFFKEGDFVIIHPEAVAAVVEVKATLNEDEFYSSIKNIKSVKEVAKKAIGQGIKCHIFGFSFFFKTKKQKITTVKNWLQNYPETLNQELCIDMITVLREMVFFRQKPFSCPDFNFRKMDKKDDFSFPMFFGELMGALETKRVISETEFIDKKSSPVKKDFASYIQRYVNIFDNHNRTWYRLCIQIGVLAKSYEEDLIKSYDCFHKNPELALKHTESALQKGCSIPEVFGDKGQFLCQLEQFEDYLKYCSEVYPKIHDSKTQKELLQMKAAAESKLRYWEDALKTYEILISNYSDGLDSINGKIYCLIGLGKYDNAIQLCDEILSNKPNEGGFLLNKGLAIKKRGDEGYKKVLNQVVNLNGNLYSKAAAFALLSNKEEMLKYLKDAVSESPIWKVEAKYDLEFDDFREDKDFKKVLEVKPLSKKKRKNEG